jgi:hypothetical protein
MVCAPILTGIALDPRRAVQACLVATSSAASTSAVERTRPIRGKRVRTVCACSSGLRARGRARPVR